MLRPVVSLKTDVIVDGDGVIENSLRYYVGTELVYDGNDFQILTEENKDSGDHFFVIADDGDSVRLISKYCLKKDALEQTDKNSSYLDTENGYGQVFSTDNYWKNISGIEYPYPLDQKDPPDEATAIKQAIAYGNSMGVRGRLLEYDEAAELEDSMTNREVVNKILVGNWTDGTAPDDENIVSMYRLYNPNSGEHFFTGNVSEMQMLSAIGWNFEGVAWTAPKTSATPVYRLYNPNAGDHHYTTSASEKNNLVKAGWKYEGIGWYSDDNKGVALYRLYNHNAKAGSHHYTVSASEKNSLMKAGWKYEGIAWYGVK
jgi:hypothetical protein